MVKITLRLLSQYKKDKLYTILLDGKELSSGFSVEFVDMYQTYHLQLPRRSKIQLNKEFFKCLDDCKTEILSSIVPNIVLGGGIIWFEKESSN